MPHDYRRIAYQYLLAGIGLLMAILIGSCSEKDSPSAPSEPVDVLQILQGLAGVEVIEIDAVMTGSRRFQIDVTQPLNHDNSEGANFMQRLHLTHFSDTLPMVFVTTGYRESPNTICETVQHLAWNQIVISHRFHDGAIPGQLTWEYLTTAQAAADYHRVVGLFKTLYPGPWLGTGRSKGGSTALFHRRFYPDDVDATIAYVAPVSLGLPDHRYMDWLNDQGDPDCQERLWKFQRFALEKRDSLLPIIDTYYNSVGSGPCFQTNIILEWLITEYRYTFWQHEDADCLGIPDSTASAQEMWDHILSICWHAPMYTVEGKLRYEPFHYEILTELGGIVTDVEHIADLLQDVDSTTVRLLGPEGTDLTFHPEVMQDINHWLQTEGNNIIYIYGGIDHVTAAAVELTGQTNALKFVIPTEDHGALAEDLNESDQTLLISALEQWLGVEID